ncbi:2'-5' RNA ligase family protein [Rhizobiales bacterium RZME27]|uniref:2'-5' RNA ligase family protein n=2 Tax=Endobacterium cereale TaxID=2663029 RepID=A0A6A8A9I9_9HYPH|nr:2'-5' RNA ligase family protein [Endobacterium cereale]MQY46310.1 2'-5' RNA ligase family protein [Endobacterium cereale]
MKTRRPLILTARIADVDLAMFDDLRTKHFPSDRNFIRAHLTMFHRLPGENTQRIVDDLAEIAAGSPRIRAEVSGVRHLGAGVAFSIASPELQDIRAALKTKFSSWLGPQDIQKWQPHITIQNKVSKAKADLLYQHLSDSFRPQLIDITDLDLWEYLGGPWRHLSFASLSRISV